ncbi:unnamed protein product [Gongylonema pulchrum]|uniref:Lebercilin domain-containing protein n=1 Tax=Gongylonema pulchrum TaxID=637853 RepID=A0A3P7NNT6_9BILA|nr:unnamed protein product [Gongylonema pulchrum]
MEREEQAQKENHFQNQQLEKQRNADYERLKTQNALLNLRQKKKDDSESDVVRLLKEQVADLRGVVRDLERQRTDMRAQIRKSSCTIKEKNDAIEQLKEEKERLEKRLNLLANSKATSRGKQAQNALFAQAVARSANSAAVTTSTKNLSVPINDAATKNLTGPTRNNVQADNDIRANDASGRARQVTFADNPDMYSDSGSDVVCLNGRPTEQNNRTLPPKNVRWNEPLATTAAPLDISPVSSHSSVTAVNSDMVGKLFWTSRRNNRGN